jgi:ADP-heptose:LPS heptosyltransferase
MNILNGAALFIGQDSGITHLAAMLGIPTIALFKITNAAQWGPLGPCVRVIGEKEASLPGVIKDACELQKQVLRQ